MAGEERQILIGISEKVGKLEAAQEANVRAIGEMAGSLKRLVEKLDASDDIAREADQRARAAHHRLDRIDKIIFWAGTTIIGAVILGVIAFVYQGGMRP